MNEPQWAKEIKSKYRAREASIFLLTGAIEDLFPWNNEDGTTEWLSLKEYLSRMGHIRNKNVIYYDVSSGFNFRYRQDKKNVYNLVNARIALKGGNEITGDLPKDPEKAINIIEDVITDHVSANMVILGYAESLAPRGDLIGDQQTTCLSIHRWAHTPAIANSDNIVFLIAESSSDINRRILASSAIHSIQIPFPDESTRLAFLNAHMDTKAQSKISAAQLARATSGLSIMQIQSILRSSATSEEPITFNSVNIRKKSIIEQECHGLVELIPVKHSFDNVGSMDGVKTILRRVVTSIHNGKHNRVPMGMIFVGPMGTGKTYVAEAFAAESGLTCLKLKNFRDRWVGATEANLDRVLGLVNALGNVLLIIDEADRALANNDDGVGSRVLARLKEFMSDTSHKGKVIILMMTNRPDLIDIDLKRPGRFDLKIPFFFPETVEERKSIFEAIVARQKLATEEGLSFEAAAADTEGYSAAEIEQIVYAALSRLEDDALDILTQENLDAAVSEIVPSRDTDMLAFMEALAVFESSSKEMLPKRYASMTTEEVRSHLAHCQLLVGKRR